jgi:predicted nuclease with RNAse H fold
MPERPLQVMGIDAAGPANLRDTSAVVLEVLGSSRVVRVIAGASDADLVAEVASRLARGPVVVGIDAPLSYCPGGGDRPSDAALRAVLRQAGLASGTVMAPTMTRMAYLTLRGVVLARALELVAREAAGAGGQPMLRIVEVHPGGTLVLGGAAPADVRALKREPAARQRLLAHLEARGLRQIPSLLAEEDHHLCAAAAALAARDWAQGRAGWQWPADPPHHPYDFACGECVAVEA